MKKKKENRKNRSANYPLNNNILFEPETVYQKFCLRKFSSFEEMNEADAKEMALLSPVIHLQNATLVTKKVYEDELNRPMAKKIKFK